MGQGMRVVSAGREKNSHFLVYRVRYCLSFTSEHILFLRFLKCVLSKFHIKKDVRHNMHNWNKQNSTDFCWSMSFSPKATYTEKLYGQWELKQFSCLGYEESRSLLIKVELKCAIAAKTDLPNECLSHRLGLGRACAFSAIPWNVPEKAVFQLRNQFYFHFDCRKKPADPPNLSSCPLLFPWITCSVYKQRWPSFHFPPQQVFPKHKDTRSVGGLGYYFFNRVI